tara:strand:- start:70 stop:201 length:132 start_codon:yes stop_codon:yes gene_type:complete
MKSLQFQNKPGVLVELQRAVVSACSNFAIISSDLARYFRIIPD